MHKVELVYEFASKDAADAFEDLVDEAFEKVSMMDVQDGDESAR